MAINRIDFQGSIIRTGDYSQKQAEDTKVAQDQTAVMSQVKKEVLDRSTTVTKTHQSEGQQQQERQDAKEKGKNEYHGDGGQNRRGQEASVKDMERLSRNVINSNGRPVDLQISKGFDLKI